MWLPTHDSRLVSSFWLVRSYVNNYKVEFQHLKSALAKESIVSCVALFLISTLFLTSSKISVLKLFLVEITSASKLRPLLLEEITDSFTILSHVSLTGYPKTCQESQDWCSLSLYVYRQKIQSEMYVNRSPILTLLPRPSPSPCLGMKLSLCNFLVMTSLPLFSCLDSVDRKGRRVKQTSNEDLRKYYELEGTQVLL